MGDEITAPVAHDLINRGERLSFVRHLGGPAFLCKSPWDTVYGDKLYDIPSWKSVYKPDPTGQRKKGIFQGFRVHFLDLPILESIAYNSGYQVKYEDREILRRLRDEYKGRMALKEKPLLEIPLKRPLDDMQIIGAQFLYKVRRAMNADDMGGGKTAQAIGAVKLNEINGKPHRTLVVCPTSVLGVWRKELGIVSDYKVLILNSNMETRFEQYTIAKEYDFIICSFDSFESDWEEMAKEIAPDILIVDECHRLCEKDNKVTQVLIGGKNHKKTFMKMAKPHSVYLLTGTPLPNRLEDLYPLLKLMDPTLMSWTGFRKRYCIIEECYRWVRVYNKVTNKTEAKQKPYWVVVGYQFEKELRGKLALHMIRRTQDVLLPDLPPKVYKTFEIELDAEERRVYDELRYKFKANVRGEDGKRVNTLTWLTRAQQICNSLETVPKSKTKRSSKMKWLLEVVAREAPKRKILIFSKWTRMTDIITRELKKYKPVIITGKTKGDRQELIDQYQDDPSRRVFIGTIKAGGVGITLTAGTLVILYDRWWSPGANDQAVARAHRRGQTKQVDCWVPRIKNSVEEYIENVWINKQLMADNMIGIEKVTKLMTLQQREALI